MADLVRQVRAGRVRALALTSRMPENDLGFSPMRSDDAAGGRLIDASRLLQQLSAGQVFDQPPIGRQKIEFRQVFEPGPPHLRKDAVLQVP